MAAEENVTLTYLGFSERGASSPKAQPFAIGMVDTNERTFLIHTSQ
jgi:hypothetical protein